MEKIKRTGLLLGLLGLLILFPLAGVKAANTGIQISPVTFNFEIAPGATEQGKITITNRNDEAMDYVMEMEMFKNTSEKGEPSFEAVTPEPGVTSFADWVTFPDGDKGSIEFGKSKDVSFVITVPADAEPGGHYGAIFAKQIKPLILDQNEVGVAARVGALALISVPGETTQGVKITEFKAPKFVWKGPVGFSMKVQNTGSVHFDSQAVAQIKNLFGQPINFELGTHTILPSSTRAFSGTWNAKYPIGYFKVTPTATGGDSGVASGTPLTMIAIPLVIVIPVIIILIVLIFAIGYLKKHVRIVK